MDPGVVIQLVVWLAFAITCALIAQNRGRSGVAWFFIGAVLGCVGLVLLLALPNPKLEQERQDRLRRENRRLRERLRKDRQVADRRHGQVVNRLGIHDEALGMDTSREIEAPAPPPLVERGAEGTAAREWFYAVNDEQRGPVSESKLAALWRAGRIRGETLVWCAEMKDWRSIGDLPELRRALDG